MSFEEDEDLKDVPADGALDLGPDDFDDIDEIDPELDAGFLNEEDEELPTGFDDDTDGNY